MNIHDRFSALLHTRRMVRSPAPLPMLARGLVLVGTLLAGFAVEAAPRDCVGAPQARTMTQAGKIVSVLAAMRVAKQATGGEMIDSRLCPGAGGRLEYVVTFLGMDGRVKRVAVDAQSGAVVRAR